VNRRSWRSEVSISRQTKSTNPGLGVASREAILNGMVETGAVDVVFQPLVDFRRKRVFAYEALARPRGEHFKNPYDLFQAAAEYRLTGALGRLVRERAVEHCPSHPLFLNIHPSELDAHFIVQPDDPIFRHSDDVYLEITEAVPLTHFALCKQVLREVRGRGIYLVVDDLGAGYSNLKYIADLYPRIVKLDRGLISGLTTQSRLHRLVSSIVTMCNDLGAMVVAEGIETLEEYEAVREAGAELGQGYLFAKPAFPPPEPVWPKAKPKPSAPPNSGPASRPPRVR
jgi:EAL domain-containing protein (putative c-di-GMP-specific phosphodiesterase class I)